MFKFIMNKSKRNRWICFSLLLGLATVNAGCFGDDEEDTTKIGVVLGFTGESSTGFNYEKAMLMVVDQVNNAGGCLGKNISLTEKDTSSNMVDSVNHVEDLLNNDVKVILGPDNADIARRIASYLTSRDILYVIAGTLLPPISLVSRPRLYLLGPGTDILTCSMARKIINDGYKKIVILHTDELFEENFAVGVENSLTTINATLPAQDQVDFERIEIETSDTLNTWATQVQALDPDAIVLAAEPRSGMNVVNAWSVLATDTDQKWYFSPTLNQQFFLDNIPSWLLEDSIVIGPPFGISSSFNLFSNEFYINWSETPFVSAGYYYDALALVTLAIEAAGQGLATFPTVTQIAAELENIANSGGQEFSWNEIGEALQAVRAGTDITYRGVTGDLDVNADNGIGVDYNGVSFWKINNGHFVYDSEGSCY
ncbi:MAG: ABC transporter substrate-binding protein [Oligoflexia bacterium]|nr:ABC transporter substrate-binding protein [Oligoflexia bacterium]